MKIIRNSSPLILVLSFLCFFGCDIGTELLTITDERRSLYFYSPSAISGSDTTIYFPKEQLKELRLSFYDGHYRGGIPLGMVTLDYLFRDIWKTDTVSFFLFDKEVVDNVPWERVVDEYMVLQRYDMTKRDLEKMDCTFYYPPTEKMKDIHMWPRYE